jgi:hypothetical protein
MGVYKLRLRFRFHFMSFVLFARFVNWGDGARVGLMGIAWCMVRARNIVLTEPKFITTSSHTCTVVEGFKYIH